MTYDNAVARRTRGSPLRTKPKTVRWHSTDWIFLRFIPVGNRMSALVRHRHAEVVREITPTLWQRSWWCAALGCWVTPDRPNYDPFSLSGLVERAA